VDYVAVQQHWSRIAGLRGAPFPPWGLLAAAFPLIGLATLLHGMRQGARAARFLEQGCLAWGQLRSTVNTHREINDQPVYEYVYGFTDEAGAARECRGATHQSHLLEANRREPVLYLPGAPESALLLALVPGGAPRLDEQGELQPRSDLLPVMVLFLPVLTLAGHGAYIFCRW